MPEIIQLISRRNATNELEKYFIITNFLSGLYAKRNVDQYERQLFSVSHLNSFELYFAMRRPIIGWFKSDRPACTFSLQSLNKT